jgi:hypothetical protein
MLDLCVFVTRSDRHERNASESGGNLLFDSGPRAVIRLVSVVSGLVSQNDPATAHTDADAFAPCLDDLQEPGSDEDIASVSATWPSSV